MSVPGPSARFVYYGDSTATLGVNLTGTDGQVGVFDPPAIDVTVQELTGSASTAPVVRQTGHEMAADTVLPIWADSTLQSLLDDIHGVTGSDRANARTLAIGWMGGGDAVGGRVDFGQAYLKSVKPKTPPAMLTELETTWAWNGLPGIGGYILHALGARTADGNSQASSVDGTAGSTAGAKACFIWTALNLDGGTAFAPRVVHSTDNVSFSALVTFTSVTATTGGGQYSTVTGTVNRYVASDWDFTGTPGGSATCTFFIAFKRN